MLGWTQEESPFHRGELAIQARLGIQAKIDKQGRQIIREFLTQQHQQFFAQLPYVIVGTVDETGFPSASILLGKPGFISILSDRLIQVTAKPLTGDPLDKNLKPGADIALLGIELSTRRRNRLNGQVTVVDGDRFEIQVGQAFGNCPQYIQARSVDFTEPPAEIPSVHSLSSLTALEQAIIRKADTFFIATSYQSDAAGAASGVDVSHRGGKPGFVRIDSSQTLTIPDFSGNGHFNTFGNLAMNPRAGLLFIDFAQGSILHLTGRAEVIWEGAEISTYVGAERLLRFHLEQGDRVEDSLPLRWSAPEFSPFLQPMGVWKS
jgi:predicted pyridoxine 5'-phosphate oxidase superfamily flavin-nucleotide-binding protein